MFSLKKILLLPVALFGVIKSGAYAQSHSSVTFHEVDFSFFGNGTIFPHISSINNTLYIPYSEWSSVERGHVVVEALTWENNELNPDNIHAYDSYSDSLPWFARIQWDPNAEPQPQGYLSWMVDQVGSVPNRLRFAIKKIGANLIPTQETTIDIPTPAINRTKCSLEKTQSKGESPKKRSLERKLFRKIHQSLGTNQKTSSNSTETFVDFPQDIAISENRVSAIVEIEAEDESSCDAVDTWLFSFDKDTLEEKYRKHIFHSNYGDKTSNSNTRHFILPDGSTLLLYFLNTEEFSSYTYKSDLIYEKHNTENGEVIERKSVLTLEEENVLISIGEFSAEYDEISGEISIEANNYRSWPSDQLYGLKIRADGTTLMPPKALPIPYNNTEIFDFSSARVPDTVDPNTGLVPGDSIRTTNVDNYYHSFPIIQALDLALEPKGSAYNATDGSCEPLVGSGSLHLNGVGDIFVGVNRYCGQHSFFNPSKLRAEIRAFRTQPTPTTGTSGTSATSGTSGTSGTSATSGTSGTSGTTGTSREIITTGKQNMPAEQSGSQISTLLLILLIGPSAALLLLLAFCLARKMRGRIESRVSDVEPGSEMEERSNISTAPLLGSPVR